MENHIKDKNHHIEDFSDSDESLNEMKNPGNVS